MSPQNHLVDEKSPYLKRQAHHPVDWYPWGKEALQLAKAQDKPVFLSIGYATCHWCHRMEDEAFSDPNIGALLNDVFVNIKVDREEHPEIDNLYMELSQVLMSTEGGWPLNVICTPDLKPFFAVSYLPAKTTDGLMGLDAFVKQIQMLWESDEKAEIIDQADKILEIFQESSVLRGGELPTEDDLQDALEGLFESVDPIYGGFKGEPKFPMSFGCDFLLNVAQMSGDSRGLFFADLTLDRMHRGGIYDQLGGGFARYAIDAAWHIPHFEKMLVDNALLAATYLHAWTVTKKESFKTVCREVLDFIQDSFATETGGFYSSLDADIDGKEGAYYTWSLHEILSILNEDEAELFCPYFGVTAIGNFKGQNVLHANLSLEEFAEATSLPQEIIVEELDRCRQKLLKVRRIGKRPERDEKVIASANGLAIHAFALAGKVLGEPRYTEIALKTAEFIRETLWQKGQLHRRYCEGEVRFVAGLDDYAYLIKGALTLFETGAGSDYFQWAVEMAERVELDFKEEGGAFFQANPDEEILLRRCEFYDGSEPSGNGVHAENLMRLYQLTHEETYLQQAEDIFKAVREFIQAFSPGSCYHMLALQRYFDSHSQTVVIALDENETLKTELEELFFSLSSPRLSIVWKQNGDARLDRWLPGHIDKVMEGGKTSVYFCTPDSCTPPLQNKEEIQKVLEGI